MVRCLKPIFIIPVLVLAIVAVFILVKNSTFPINSTSPTPSSTNQKEEENFPMFVESLRKRDYPASGVVIEETLNPGVNYQRFIASYLSDGLKIYGLLTIPNAPKPEKGYPVIIVLHGYVNPQLYSTTEDYAASQDVLAGNNFITFKPDFRGHGESEGKALGAHFSEGYVVDTLNLISALKSYPQIDPAKISLWGHSNGGKIALQIMVVSSDIKAAVIWAGVVGSFEDMLETYNSKIPFLRQPSSLVKEKGLPSANPNFWNKLDPYFYLKDIFTPIQLHHGTADPQVPVELSLHLKIALEKESKKVEYYEYPGANHNFSGSDFNLAAQRSIDFFKSLLFAF